MTIKEHEDKYVHINKEKLGIMLLFGLMGAGLIILSICSANESITNSRDEAREYCFAKYSQGDDYVIVSNDYKKCESTYMPIASGIVNAILLVAGVLLIIFGFVEVSGNE